MTLTYSRRTAPCQALNHTGQHCRVSARPGSRWCGNHQQRRPHGVVVPQVAEVIGRAIAAAEEAA